MEKVTVSFGEFLAYSCHLQVPDHHGTWVTYMIGIWMTLEVTGNWRKDFDKKKFCGATCSATCQLWGARHEVSPLLEPTSPALGSA